VQETTNTAQLWATKIADWYNVDIWTELHLGIVSKAKQRCVIGVGMCLYAQLVQTKNK